MEKTAEQNLIDNMEYIRKIVNNSIMKNVGFHRFFDIEDMYQEAYIAYWEAMKKYDKERGAKCMTFAAKVIKHRLAEILRKKSLINAYGEESFENIQELLGYNTVFEEKGFELAEWKMIVTQMDMELQFLYEKTRCKTYRYGILAIQYSLHFEYNNISYDRKYLAQRIGTNTSYLSVCMARTRKEYLVSILQKVFDKQIDLDNFASLAG